MKQLTAKQDQVLDFIRDYMQKHKMAPTHAEIQEHFNWRSATASVDHLNRLEEKGWLSIRRKVARGIWAVKQR